MLIPTFMWNRNTACKQDWMPHGRFLAAQDTWPFSSVPWGVFSKKLGFKTWSYKQKHCRCFTVHACIPSCSVVPDCFATPWTIAHQAPLSMGFPRQEYWSELPFPPPGDLPHPGIKPASLCLLYWQVGFYYCAAWKAPIFAVRRKQILQWSQIDKPAFGRFIEK